MSSIQQIYCTHCTYGSSALEQREGELADRVLGYSARASSLERGELRNYYRQIERFLYYYLPTDTPTEEKLRLDAATAPRRLFYSPALGDIQVLGQMSYRQQDTAGRPGSYFGHVLFGPRNEPWSPLDCLKLWGAAWRDEDSEGLAATLPALDRLDEVLAGERPAIDDSVLLSFLETPPGEPFDDPRQVIPERWKSIDPALRTELLVETLQGFLNLGSQRRENLLLVVEPSVAALMFYGVARLLPPGPVREGLSFSTFEPNADRLPVSLAATTFHSPKTTDLRPDAYRRRGYVHNTFLDRHSDHGQPEGHYGRLLVGTLLSDGWKAVDQLFSGFAAAGAKTPEDLELLADIHQLVPQVLNPAVPLGETKWRQSDVAVRYLSQAVHLQLANDNAGWPQLRALIGSPNQLLVMELIASAPAAADIQGPLQYLLRKMPPDKFGELLASARLTRSAKVEALAYHLSSVGRFPEHCESLWSEGSRIGSLVAGRAEPLLPAVLSRLPAPVIGPLYRTLPAELADLFLLAFLQGARPEPSLQAAQRAVAGDIFKSMDDRRFTEWLLDHRDELRHFFPPPDGVLRPRLAGLLYEAPNVPEQFDARVEALEGWVDYFSEPSLAERRLVQWRKIRSILSTIRDLEQKKPGNRLEAVFRKPKPPDYRALAEALQSAMPANVYPDDLRGTRKLECLEGLGRVLVGRADFLPPVVRSRMVRFFEYGDWSEYSSRTSKKGKSSAKKPAYRRKASQPAWRRVVSTKLFAFACGVAAIVIAGMAYHWFGGGPDEELADSGSEVRAPSDKPNVDATPKGAGKQQPASGSPGKSKMSSGKSSGPVPAAKPLRTDDGERDDPKTVPSAPREKPAPDKVKLGVDSQSPPPPKKPASGDDGEAAPAASNTDSPSPQDVALRRVSKVVELPSPNSATAAAKPIELIRWSEPPAQSKLRLHGLELANQRLKEQSADPEAYPRLKLQGDDEDEWKVTVQTGGSAPSDPSEDLATFSQTATALTFRWQGSDRSPQRMAAQDWLKACVLEFERDAEQDFFLLAPPVKLSEAHFTNGATEIRPKPSAGMPPQWFEAVELRLAFCTVYFNNQRELTLIAGDRPADPVAADGLAQSAGVGKVGVDLKRADKKEGVWRLSLQIGPPASLVEQRQRRARDQSDLETLNAELAAHGKRDPPSSPERKRAAVRALADLLQTEPPVEPEAKEGDADGQTRARDDYDKAVEEQILEPARQRQRELQSKSRRAAEALKEVEAKFKLNAGTLRSRAASISAVLYRLVDDQLQADCMTIGDPIDPAEGGSVNPAR